MANTVIALKKSGTPAATPSSLEFGELAINYADGVLYYKAANSTIYPFSSGGNAFATVNANGTLIVADTSSDVFSLTAGDYINIVGDGINDTIAISANVKLPYDTANSAFDKANALISVSNVAPVSPTSNNLWWNSETGSLYIYYQDTNSSQWVQIGGGGGSSGGGGGTTLARETVYFDTSSLVNNGSENMNVSISKTFSLMKLITTRSAWIRLYSDSASRTADESRSIGIDPVSGSGLLAEFVTTANVIQKVTPFILCGNLEEPVTSNVYIRVTNLSGTTGTINTSMSIMALET